MLRSAVKILLAAAIMGLVCLPLVHLSHSRILNVLFGIPLGAGVFSLAASILRIPEFAQTRNAVIGKLRQGR